MKLKDFRCEMQPDNPGLRCVGIRDCAVCGWNPAVAEERHKETIINYKIKEHSRNEYCDPDWECD